MRPFELIETVGGKDTAIPVGADSVEGLDTIAVEYAGMSGAEARDRIAEIEDRYETGEAIGDAVATVLSRLEGISQDDPEVDECDEFDEDEDDDDIHFDDDDLDDDDDDFDDDDDLDDDDDDDFDDDDLDDDDDDI